MRVLITLIILALVLVSAVSALFWSEISAKFSVFTFHSNRSDSVIRISSYDTIFTRSDIVSLFEQITVNSPENTNFYFCPDQMGYPAILAIYNIDNIHKVAYLGEGNDNTVLMLITGSGKYLHKYDQIKEPISRLDLPKYESSFMK